MGDAGAILDRLDGSDLVVGVHDADEDRARRDRSAQLVGIDPPGAVNRQIGDAGAQPLEKRAGFDDGRMLDARGDDVIAAVAVRKEHALEGEVVGLAAAARKNDLVASAAEQRRHLAARRLEGDLCRRCRPMSARRIAVVILEKRPHRGGDRRIDRRAGVVVEIDATHVQNTRDQSFYAVAATARPSTGRPASVHCSIPRRRTTTCVKPAARKVRAAVAERLSVLQTRTSGAPSSPASSANRPLSSATGILRAVAIWPNDPVNSSGPRTSITVTPSPPSSRRLRSFGSIHVNEWRMRPTSRGSNAIAASKASANKP